MNVKRTFDNSKIETVHVFPSYDEIQHHVARAHKLRAEATAQMLLQAGRGMARVVRPALAGLARWHQQSRTRDALMRCSDRVLADVGIAREHIPLVAKGIDPAEYELKDRVLQRWWAAAHARLDAARAARRERRRLYRELDAYDDRELEEIGLRRADIPVIARGQPVFRRAA